MFDLYLDPDLDLDPDPDHHLDPDLVINLNINWDLNLDLDLALLRVAKGEESGQPAAADMRELVWDDELEAIAQR